MHIPDFSIVPLSILSDPDITFRELKVYTAIKSFMNKQTGECYPSRSTLAAITGLPESRISVVTDLLEQHGWLKKTGNGGRSRPCNYTVFCSKKTVTEMETVTETDTVTNLVTVTEMETVTDLDVNSYQFGTETVTETVRGNEQTIEQTTEQNIHTSAAAASPPAADVNGKRKPKSEKPKSTCRLLPDDFVLSDSLMEWASKNGHTHMQERYDYFVEQAKIKAYQYANWDLAFQKSVRENWARINTQALFNSNTPSKPGGYNGYQKPTPMHPNDRMLATRAAKQSQNAAFNSSETGRLLSGVQYSVER